MSYGIEVDRRRFVQGTMCLGIAGCAASPVGTLPREGSAIYSESVQVSLADHTARNFLLVRICQYPDAGIAWVWIAIFLDGAFWKYENNAVRWRGGASVRSGEEASEYKLENDTVRVRFERNGTVVAPNSGTMSFQSSREDVRADVTFAPANQFVGLIPGRSEVFGIAKADVRIGGRKMVFSGPGQWHEQQQTEPRFTVPFIYASLWGENVHSTLLQTPKGAGGYIIRDNNTYRFTSAEFGPPGANRIVRLFGRDGNESIVSLQEIHHYRLTIYDKPWRGSFVKAEHSGVSLRGIVNNWRM